MPNKIFSSLPEKQNRHKEKKKVTRTHNVVYKGKRMKDRKERRKKERKKKRRRKVNKGIDVFKSQNHNIINSSYQNQKPHHHFRTLKKKKNMQMETKKKD